MTPTDVQDLVQRLERDDPLGLGSVRWQAQRLEDRRYSSIYRLAPEPDDKAGRGRTIDVELVLKVYRAPHPERRQGEYDDLVRIHAAMGPDGGIVRPIACYAERGAIVTLRAHGVPLVRLVRAACRRPSESRALARAAALCTAAGDWLRRFQQAGAAAMRGCRPEHLGDPDGFLAYVGERLRLLRGTHPGIEPVLQARLLAHCAATLHALPARAFAPVTWSHSDLGPHNMLVDGDRLSVLDFELAPQHPYFDAAYFVESLAHAAGPLVDPSRVHRLERAFLAGYAAEIEPPLFALFRLRHLVCTYVSEARRGGGILQLRTWPGLLAMRTRLRQMPHVLSLGGGSRAA